MKNYIVLFDDGSMMPFMKKPIRKTFGKNCRLFVAKKVNMMDIINWYASNFKDTGKIEEIEWK